MVGIDERDALIAVIRLEDAVPIDMRWDEWQMRDWNAPRLLELFTEWNFRRCPAAFR